MDAVKRFTLPLLVVFLLALFAQSSAHAQISVGIGVGDAPACPYGYYDYSPYNCAPYGYYGPEWFNGGVFIGAGPWFHGPSGFHGHTNYHMDPRHGYSGHLPDRGEAPAQQHGHFRGNELRDGQGHGDHDGH